AVVNALAVSAGTGYAGGSLSVAGGAARNLFAAVDAGSGAATSWNPMIGGNGAGYAIAVAGVHAYAGGSFTNIGNVPQHNAACLYASGILAVPDAGPGPAAV